MDNNTWSVSEISVHSKSVHPMILTRHDELFILEKEKEVLRYRKSPLLGSQKDELVQNLPKKEVSSVALGYDSENDASYMLLGDPLSIYDISDFHKIKKIYPGTSESKFVVELGKTPCIQITNDTMYVPSVSDGTQALDLNTMTWKTVASIYNQLPGNYCKVLCGKKYKFREGDSIVTVEDLSKSGEDHLRLQEPAPIHNVNSVIAFGDGFYYWDDHRGLMKIDILGDLSEIISIKDIENWAQYSPLTGTQNIGVNQNGTCALGFPRAGKILVLQRNNRSEFF